MPVATQPALDASKLPIEAQEAIRRATVERTPVLIEGNDGQVVGAVISADDLHFLEVRKRANTDWRANLDAMRAAFIDVSSEEIEREARRAIDEVRADKRAERANASE